MRKKIKAVGRKTETLEGLKIGDKLLMIPECFYLISDPLEPQLRPCTVVYINMAHRFFTVEFKFSNGNKIWESYKFMLKGDRMPCMNKPRKQWGNVVSEMV